MDADTKSGPNSTGILSSAARCIRLNLLNHSFHPVFTHQLFQNEEIRGYLSSIDPSSSENDGWKRELSIEIRLLACCSQCTLNMDIRQPKRRLRERSPSPRKIISRHTTRLINGHNSETTNDEGSFDEYSEADDATSTTESTGISAFVDDEQPSINELEIKNEEGRTRQRRMPATEIKECLSKALPEILSQPDSSQIEDQFLKLMPGTFLEQYKRGDQTFCLTLASGSDAGSYHDHVQKLALFFIETADHVDLADERDGSAWKVLYLFEAHGLRKHSFVGYITLYQFNSPFRKPIAGTIVRICQSLILPPYQRSGHGCKMLSTLYKWIDNGYNQQLKTEASLLPTDIVEVNVENPAPAYVALRNKIDYERFHRAKSAGDSWLGDSVDVSMSADVCTKGFFDHASEPALNRASIRAKISLKQVQIVYEILRLHQLRVWQQRACDTEQAEVMEKSYRLMVKKRLQKDYREDLGACRTKEEMRNLLVERYEDALCLYGELIVKHENA